VLSEPEYLPNPEGTYDLIVEVESAYVLINHLQEARGQGMPGLMCQHFTFL
jgi:hypothetical protein